MAFRINKTFIKLGRTDRHCAERKVSVCSSLAVVALATTAFAPVSNRGAQIQQETVSKITRTLILQGINIH